MQVREPGPAEATHRQRWTKEAGHAIIGSGFMDSRQHGHCRKH